MSAAGTVALYARGRPSDGPSPTPRRRRPIPNLSLKSWPPVIALIAVLAIAAVFALPGRSGAPPATLAARMLVFRTGADGATAITTDRGAPVAVLAAGAQSFGHGFVHTLAVLRARYGVPADRPYRLALFADGRLLLTDPSTPVAIDVESFGPTNAREIAGWLAPPNEPAKTAPSP